MKYDVKGHTWGFFQDFLLQVRLIKSVLFCKSTRMIKTLQSLYILPAVKKSENKPTLY